METSVMTSKGQILVPRRLRRKLNMKPGSKIAFIEHGDEILIKSLDKSYFEKFKGLTKGGGSLIDELIKEKTKERER
ncbi:MAG: AbrB/MazE/SpoVT family DNA-binding domain-containing protein [Chitinophagales bacterium]